MEHGNTSELAVEVGQTAIELGDPTLQNIGAVMTVTSSPTREVGKSLPQ